MEEYKVLAMNFGSTSTKVAVYEGDTCLLQQVFHHSPKDLEGVSSMEENAALRKPLILSYLAQQGVNMEEFGTRQMKYSKDPEDLRKSPHS